MNVIDMYDALERMVCLVDSREQDTPRLRARIEQIGCECAREALPFGDYSAKFPLDNGEWFTLADKVSIERKMHIDELCQCYCNGRERFEREFERAKEAGAKIYMLIEDATWEKSLQWQIPKPNEALCACCVNTCMVGTV